ncbi:MAG: sugar phosphate isomerase/epimerase family protein [Candidatus Neoclostridium sp.]
MKRTGMCSVTFRNKSAEEIIALAKENGLEYVEWGGDVHVPAGDFSAAEKVRLLCKTEGIKIASYGSYYRFDGFDDFVTVSKTAKTLGAGTVRVWAGSKNSNDFSLKEFADLTEAVKKCADHAAANGQTVAFEYHHGTYCDNAQSALKLLREVDRENVKTYWQPMYWLNASEEEKFAADKLSIEALKDEIVNVHVYCWKNGSDRRALSEGSEQWREYLALLPCGNYYLEFVKDDAPCRLAKDAAELIKLIKEDAVRGKR